MLSIDDVPWSISFSYDRSCDDDAFYGVFGWQRWYGHIYVGFQIPLFPMIHQLTALVCYYSMPLKLSGLVSVEALTRYYW